MEQRGHHMHFTCACGHKRSIFMGDVPDAWKTEYGWCLTDEALARMVCLACGRRGRPQGIIINWSAGVDPLGSTQIVLADKPEG